MWLESTHRVKSNCVIRWSQRFIIMSGMGREKIIIICRKLFSESRESGFDMYISCYLYGNNFGQSAVIIFV